MQKLNIAQVNLKTTTIKRTIPFIVFLVASCASKNHIYYHGIELTARSIPFRVYEWNTQEHEIINQKKNIHFLIKETIDDKKRVTQLEFLRKGQLSEFANFPVAKVTYEYVDNKIIETLYDENEKTLYVDKHISHYQSIYYLTQDLYIEKVERIADFETVDSIWFELNMEPPSEEELQKSLEEFSKKGPLEIDFYKYSYYKLHGIYPVSRDFVIDTTQYSWKLTNIKRVDGKITGDTVYIRNLIQKGIEDGMIRD